MTEFTPERIEVVKRAVWDALYDCPAINDTMVDAAVRAALRADAAWLAEHPHLDIVEHAERISPARQRSYARREALQRVFAHKEKSRG